MRSPGWQRRNKWSASRDPVNPAPMIAMSCGRLRLLSSLAVVVIAIPICKNSLPEERASALVLLVARSLRETPSS
jgi:hypothetical protein